MAFKYFHKYFHKYQSHIGREWSITFPPSNYNFVIQGIYIMQNNNIDEFKGAIIESSDNVTYTDNIKASLDLFGQVGGFIDNLKNDYKGVETYLNDLRTLKMRGFKVDNSIARLEFQLDQTQVSITSLKKQKLNRLLLLKTDIIELSKSVLNKRLIIDDKEQARIDGFFKELKDIQDKKDDFDTTDIEQLVTISLNHMSDLLLDVGKFDSQIEEAMKYARRNYDIGDLVNTLKQQKDGLKSSYDIFLTNFARLSIKHLSRTKNYIEDIKKEAQKIRDAPKEDSNASIDGANANN